MRGALGGLAAAYILLLCQPLGAMVPGDLADAPPQIVRGEVPGWIVPRTIPAETPSLRERARSGIAYLMTDWQTRIGAVGNESYYRVTMKVVDRSGLEDAGKIQEDFDPRFQKLALNFVHIIRDGQVIDLTPQVGFRLVQRETELDEGILTGQLTMIATLRDVRVGDVVDYATTTNSHDSLWRGHFFSSFPARMSEPLGLRMIRIDAPSGMPLKYKALNANFSFNETLGAGRRIWEWQLSDAVTQNQESDVPDWFPEYGTVDVSSMRSWGEVVRWAIPLYAGDEKLTPEFEAVLEGIARRWPKPADRLTEVTRYLQDNIRYLGEEMGEGSFIPRRPRAVLEQGYGDCKDKSLLLALALRRLGIDAWPALAALDTGMGLPDHLPSPTGFDHVIVRAEVGGTVLWIDPTSTHQGGRGVSIVPADYGYGLPIRPGQTGLERMTGYGKRAGRSSIAEYFSIDGASDPAMALQVFSDYTDGLADRMRAVLAAKPATDVTRDNLAFYRTRFNGLEAAEPLKIEDDRDANHIRIIENYRLSLADFKKGRLLDKFVTSAFSLSGTLPRRQAEPRRNPLEIPDHLDDEHIIELTFKDRRIEGPDDIEAKAGGIMFTRRSTSEGNTVRMVYRLTSGAAGFVAADQADAVYELSERIADEYALEYRWSDVP